MPKPPRERPKAWSSSPPFTELHEARSISAYGDAKLAAERAAAEFAARSGVNVLTGRISNLYGPGQNLAKPQGLVSHICRAQLSGQPISVYVSLDTVRDYLYVDDASGLICDALDRLADAPAGTAVTTLTLSTTTNKVTQNTATDFDAYSAFFTFSANRAHFTGETCAAASDCQTGQTCSTAGVCQ